MPHGLGSAGDFGHQFNSEDLPGEPESQGNIKRLEDLLAAEEEEAGILGPDENLDAASGDEVTDEFADSLSELAEDDEPELREVSVEELQQMILGAAGVDEPRYELRREYYMAPEQLVVLVHHEIITVDEARNYLKSQGIELW